MAKPNKDKARLVDTDEQGETWGHGAETISVSFLLTLITVAVLLGIAIALIPFD